MKILKDRFYEIINALDGIRCDNRENKQYYDNENDLRQIPQDIMEYIERKGYCKYIYGANGRFVRTLTEKGYDVLQYMNYSKYKRRKSIANWKTWLSIGISIVALIASVYVASRNNQPFNKRGADKSNTDRLITKIYKRIDKFFESSDDQNTKSNQASLEVLARIAS
jgi:hypothetical protein